MAEKWLELLRQAVDADPRGRAGVAEKIGFSRPAISQVLSGVYPARPDKIARAVVDHYDKPDCILMNKVIDRPLCRRVSLIPEPQGGDARVRWLTCQTCPHKPQE
jgi:hypothetical protein